MTGSIVLRLMPYPLVYHRQGPAPITAVLTHLDAVWLSVRGLAAAGLIASRVLRGVAV